MYSKRHFRVRLPEVYFQDWHLFNFSWCFCPTPHPTPLLYEIVMIMQTNTIEKYVQHIWAIRLTRKHRSFKICLPSPHEVVVGVSESRGMRLSKLQSFSRENVAFKRNDIQRDKVQKILCIYSDNALILTMEVRVGFQNKDLATNFSGLLQHTAL